MMKPVRAFPRLLVLPGSSWNRLPLLVTFAFLTVAFLLFLTGCGGGLSDDEAVRINGTVITRDQVAAMIDFRNKLLPGMVNSSDTANFPKIQRQTAKDMVWFELEKQEASRRGIAVSPEEVDSALQDMADDQYLSDIQRMVDDYGQKGITLEQLRADATQRLLNGKLQADVAKDVPVAESDIEAYYQKNIKQYVQPELRQTRLIETDTETAAQQAADRINGGENFVDVAKQVSVDPQAATNGGNRGMVAPGQLPPEVDNVLFSLAMNQVSAPVASGGRWYVVRAEVIEPGVNKPLDQVRAEIKEAIAKELSAEKWQTLLDGLYADADLQYAPDYDPAKL